MAYHTLAQAAKLLGYEEPKPKETKLIFDLEKGKAGYNQYLADVEAEKAAKEQASKEKKWWEKLLEANAKNYTSLPSDANASAIAFANAVNFYAQDDSYKKPSDDWTDDERWAFGEKYANNKDEAYAFAEQVNNAHAQKSREDQAQKISDWTNKNTVNKWVGSAASLGINAVAGGLGFVDSAAQQVGRGKIVRHDFLMPHEVSGKIQDTVATGLNERYGTVNFLGGERGWGDVYGLGMSIGQSTLAGVTGGSAGALVQFFGMAASQGVTDALERGATSEQALAFGTVSGLAEAIPEMISVKSLLGIASAEGVQNVFKAVAKQAGEEALEEFETSVINEVADRWIMGGKSQFALTVQELMASGMTQAQAENAAWKQTFQNLTYDVITGAASGGISGAGAASFQKVNQKYLQTQKNAEAKETLTPKVNELIEEGKKYKPTEKRSSNLEKKIAEGKEASGYELRMLASEVSKASRDADVETLRKAIVEKMKAEGLTDNQAKRLGEIALNKAIGNEVSALQNSFLKNNAAAMKVYNQMDTDNMLSGYSDSEWTKETPLAKLKAESGELQKGIEKRLNNVRTEYDQSKIVDKSGKAVFEKSSADSKIHLDGISSELTKNNVAQLKAIEKLANELGVDIHVYETTLNENGERVFVDKDGNKVTSSGFYDPKNKSIHIDLRAGNKGEGTMLYTASHELVHYMKDVSKEHYDALEKLVTDELIKGGKSIETLMEEQRQKARENGQSLTDDEIREEMIADACQSFLASKNAVAEIKALKTKNKSLWTALKKFFTSLFTKLDKIYKTVDPDGAEGKYIADMRNSVKNIRDAFMEGVTAAGEKYSAERKALGEGANVKVNASGEFVLGSTQDGKKIMSNARTWENGGRTTLKKTLESEGFSEGDVTQTYPENFADMLSDELKARDIYAKKQDAKWDDAMAEINDYLETHTRADTVKYADEHGIKISDKDRKLAKQETAGKIKHMARGKVDTYTEKEYNDFGWVRANDVVNEGYWNNFTRNYADAVYNKAFDKITPDGEYMIAIYDENLKEHLQVIDHIVFAKGSIKSPNITRIIRIYEADETKLNKYRRNIYDFERRGIQQKTGELLELHSKADFGAYDQESYSRKVSEYSEQLGANRGASSGAAQRTEKEIPQNLGHYPVVETFTDIGGRSRKVRRLNGQYKIEGTSRKNALYDTINEAIEAENNALIRRYAFQNNKLLSRVKAEVANDPKALYGKIPMNKDGVRYQARDTVGNTLTAAQQEYFKDSKVRDSKGNLMVLYHGTTADFNVFKRGDVGFHFGTKGAARGRVGYGKNVTLKEVYLNITNPIVFDDDLGSWDADYRLTRELYDRGILTQSEAETVLLTDSKQYRRTTEAANKKLAEVLLSKGYDGIEYTNTHESKKNSTSYIIFDSNQAKDITNKTPTKNADIRHSGRNRYTEYDKPITIEDVNALRNILQKHGVERVSVNEFDSDDIASAQKWAYKFYTTDDLGVKSPFFRAWFGDWREFDDKTRVNVVKQQGNTTFAAGKIKNEDVKELISWGHDLKSETVNHAVGEKSSISAIVDIGDIVLNALYLDTVISNPTSKTKMPNTAFMHSFYTLYKTKNGEYNLLKLFVEEALSNNEKTIFKRAYQLKDIQKVANIPNSVLSTSGGLTDDTSATTISVADLFALVKQYDKDFSPKAANPLLLDENKQPKVVYHGTPNGKFTEFDYDKVGTVGGSQHGYGFYFADSEREAKLYTQGTGTVIPAYINLQNPINAMEKDLSANVKAIFERLPRYAITNIESEYGSLEAAEKRYAKYDNGTMLSIMGKDTEMHPMVFNNVLLNLGYDGIIYSEEGYDTEYVVFKPEQIKSATDNIGTFDKGERNIRYQARRASNPAPYISPTATSIVTNIQSGYTPTKMDKLKTSAIATQIAFTNAQAGIEAIAKKYGVKNIEALVQAARVATNQAEEMIGGNQYRIGSNTKDYLGEGLQKIIKPIQELGAEHEAAFYDYLFHQHNADRMSLERRSIEWNEQNKTELKDLSNKFAEIEKEQKALTDEKANLSRKQTDSKRRGEINLRLTEIKRELKALGKNIKALRQEIASFTALKNKPVIGFNHDEIEAQKAEIMARIRELQDEKKSLSKKKGAEARIKEIAQEIADLVKERSELTAEVNEEKSREIIDEYEKNYPEFVEVAEKIWNYNKNLNQYRVDTGLIDQAQFDYLNKLYPHYVPSYRSDNKTGIAAVKGKNNLAITQTVKTATGSTKDLLNPIVIMARQTMETVRAGRINQIAKALYDGANTAKDKTYLNEVSREKIDRAKLADLDPTELRPKSNQVTFFKDGERITLQVSSEIFAGFDAFSPQFNVQNPLVMAATAMNNAFKKLVTSANPVFLVRNTIRDIQDAGINTKYAKTFMMINYARAANEIRKGGKLWELYRAMGGGNVSYFDFDKGFKAEQSKHGFESGWLHSIENANAFVECLPRFAEFISSLEAGNSAEQAMLDAADVTTNFARTGRITKALNSTIIPFLNPAIQGASKAIRNVTSVRSAKEAAILAAKAVLVGILPFALNSLLYDDDEDYQDLRETDKENNYLFKIGDKFIKIPRGRVAAVLAGALNRTVKSFDDDENADWAGYLKNVSTQMNPIENMARTIFSPFMDVANNVTWYGSAIEGREFENKSPAQRYDESTSSIAIALGQVLNYSPKKIHYLLDQYSGVIGDFVLPATTKKAEKDFISGNFTIDPVTSNKLSDEFYDIYYEAQYAKNANKNDKTAEYQVKHLNRVKSAISNMYDEISKIQNSNMSDSAKLKETRAIRILINEMYKTALNDYELVTNAIEATSHVKDEYRYAEVQRLVYGSEAALKTYDEKVYEKSKTLKKAGISYDNFYKYYFGIKDIKSDKDKNGNTISGSKRKKVIEKINSLKLSEEKKLLLIAYSGYALDSEADEKKLMKYLNSLKLSSSTKENLAEICGFDYKNGKIVFK